MCRHSQKKPFVKISQMHAKDGKPKVKTAVWSSWLVGAIAFLCYVNSLRCGLVFDDHPAIIGNMDLRPKTPISNLLYDDFWGTPMHKEESHKSYRPLCVLTFRLNYLVHGLDSFGYHLINVLLHIVVCLLYHRFSFQVLPFRSNLVASFLFAVHPIHTEAVTGVVGRAELLSAIFFLLTLRTYTLSTQQMKPNNYRAIFKCLVLSGLAMLSKEQGITVVVVCLVYDAMTIQKITGPPGRHPRNKVKGPTPTWRKDLVLRLLIMTSGTTIMLVARMRLMGNRIPVFNRFDNPAAYEPWPTRYLTHHYLVSLNTWLLLFPSDLCCDWTMGTVPLVSSFFDVRLVPTVLVYSVILMLVWTGYQVQEKISTIVIMGVSLCVFPFIPASNLLYPVGFVVAERVLYIPSMGMCLLIAHGFDILCNKYRNQRYYLYFGVVILMCLNIAKTIHRNFDWYDEESLFTSGLKVTKSNAKLYNNLGHVMESRGKDEDALRLFLRATEVQPDDLGSHMNVGRMYNALGQTEKAERAFRVAKELLPRAKKGPASLTHIVPGHMNLFINLGNLLSRNSTRLEEAQELFKEAIIMKTDYIEAYIQRANVLLKLNRSEEAHDMYKEALKYDHMNPDILYRMGVLLLEQGKSQQALTHFDQALKVDPEHEKSLLNYAILTQDTGDSGHRKLAHERLRVLLDKGSQPERTYFNLGMLAMQDGNVEEAEDYFRKTLQLRGDFEAALFNLALVLHESGRPLESVPHLLRLRSGHTKGMLLLGNIYFAHLHNYTAAKECYELIIKQDPTHVAAMLNLCATFFQVGRLDEAESCLLHASLAPHQDSHLVDRHLSLVRQERQRLASSQNPQKVCTTQSGLNCELQAKQIPKMNGLTFSSGRQTWK